MAYLSAGEISPGPKPFKVVDAHEHETLKFGDIVRVIDTPMMRMYLIRDDFTVHNMEDDYDNYVTLESQEQ